MMSDDDTEQVVRQPLQPFHRAPEPVVADPALRPVEEGHSSAGLWPMSFCQYAIIIAWR